MVKTSKEMALRAIFFSLILTLNDFMDGRYLLVSLDDTGEDTTRKPIDKVSVIETKAKTLPTLTNVDYVLRGYNILRGNPIATGYEADPGFDNTIFEAIYSDATTGDLRYRIPDGYSVFSKPICIIDFLSDYFVNEKTYQEELAVTVNLDFSGWRAAFSADNEYKDRTNKMSKYEHLFVKTESVCGVYEVVMDQYNPPKLRQGFLNAAKTLENVNDHDAYVKFVNVYGTHFLVTTHMGAKYAEETELTKQSKENMEQENIDINVAASYSAIFHLGLDTHTNIDTKLVQRFDKEAVSRSIISYGSRPPMNGSAVDWANSVFEEPLPISYNLLQIDEIFTSIYMEHTDIAYEKVRSALENFLKNYCESQKNSLGISTCDGPNGGCAGGHDCHHNAHCSDVIMEHNVTNYDCVCNQDYFGNGFECSGWNIQTELITDRYGEEGWGHWKDVALCPNETYASAFALKIHPKDGNSWIKDDSALNGVKLYCKSFDHKTTGEVTSGIGRLGSWKGLSKCSHEFLHGLRFRARGHIVGDDVFGTNLDMSCQSGEILNGQGINDWGSWSSWTFCPAESAICGLQTKIHDDDVGKFKDDAGLTNIRFLCCKI